VIEREGERLLVKVPLLMANATGLLEAGCLAIQSGEQVFDFSAVAEADSSALAVMLGWLRAGASSGAVVKFDQVPAGVRSLAELYGVKELLSLA
jgi:phospholipid transport system transporter-binding protein